MRSNVYVFALSVLALTVLASGASSASALSESATLIRFYRLANGDRWTRSEGWAEAARIEGGGGGGGGGGIDTAEQMADHASICSWYGITCKEGKDDGDADTVAEIDLSYNHLSGRVSHRLWSLPNLKVADLHGNLLTDAGLEGFADSSFPSHSPVETLYLSENKLTDLDGISSAADTLRHLYIGSNSFEGHFPEEVYRLKKLYTLHASKNSGLTGTLSSHFGAMTSLKELELSYTSIRGTIPTELGNLFSLELLGLDNNRIHGTIPLELEVLFSLKYLSIQNDEVTSNRLSGPMPAFRECSDLKELYLNDNALTGTIPKDLLEYTNLHDKAVAVSVRNNKIRGDIPAELGDRFDKLHIEAGGNKINSIPQSLCQKNNWMTGAVEWFQCDAILCPQGKYRLNSGRREYLEDECIPCPDGVAGAPHMGSIGCIGGATSSSSSSSPTGSSEGDVAAAVFLSLAGAAALALVAILVYVDGRVRREARAAAELEFELEKRALEEEEEVVFDYAPPPACGGMGGGDKAAGGMFDVDLGPQRLKWSIV